MKKLIDGLYIIPGLVNMYLAKMAGGWTLIDTGFPKSEDKTIQSIRSVGMEPEDIRHMVLTHCHVDHVGGAAALKRASGATTYAHQDDVAIIQGERGFRPVKPSPGLRNRVLGTLITKIVPKVEPTHVDVTLESGRPLPFADDVSVVHIPGHCQGQVALLWARDGGVLIAADACVNRKGLQYAVVNEDIGEARRSLEKLSKLEFEIACFGHGDPILSGASGEFRRTWLPA